MGRLDFTCACRLASSCTPRNIEVRPLLGVQVIAVRITLDADKRAAVLEQRGIDMLDAGKAFAGPTIGAITAKRAI
jgi:hypothetical protein